MKAYQKPVLYYEKVELSQHIASCDFKLNFGLGSGCTAKGEVWGVPFEGIFINSDAAAQYRRRTTATRIPPRS